MGVAFHFQDYSVEVWDRGPQALVATFAPKTKSYRRPASERPAWGADFLKGRGVSGLHVKSGQACWYRKPQLEVFFLRARAAGLFDAFDTVMTYGGSMGGFGALSFAGLCKAQAVLSINPQVNLGPAVRDWETRFKGAMQFGWDDDLTNIDRQLRAVRRPVLVYDAYHLQDRKQADLVTVPQAIRINVPFVGHQMPRHLLNMRVLGTLFDAVLSDTLDRTAICQALRKRRQLLRYRETLLEKAGPSLKRRTIIETALPLDAMIGSA